MGTEKQVALVPVRPFKKALHVLRGTKEHKYHKYTTAMPLLLPELKEPKVFSYGKADRTALSHIHKAGKCALSPSTIPLLL